MKQTSVSKLAAALFVAALSLGFTACSDDDENENENYNFSFTTNCDVPDNLDEFRRLLVGQWYLVGTMSTSPQEVDDEDLINARAARLQGIADGLDLTKYGLDPIEYDDGIDEKYYEFKEDGNVYEIIHYTADADSPYAGKYIGYKKGSLFKITTNPQDEKYWEISWKTGEVPGKYAPIESWASTLCWRLNSTVLITGNPIISYFYKTPRNCYIRVKKSIRYEVPEVDQK